MSNFKLFIFNIIFFFLDFINLIDIILIDYIHTLELGYIA